MTRIARTCSFALALASGTGIALTPAMSFAASCGFSVAFNQKDEGGAKSVRVFRAGSAATVQGKRPFAFIVPNVKVNTDGTRISYKADDPRGENGAINNIRNAYNNHHRPVSDFEAIRDAGWQPASKVWQILNPNIIEKDARPGHAGKPCMDANGFLVSMTADTAVSGGFNRIGDCDQSKWIDALTVPAFVLPKNSPFSEAGKRSVVVAMSLDSAHRIALGIIGDVGPADEIGEASVEMNRILNGLPDGTIPQNRTDAKHRFQGGQTVFLVLPGDDNRVARPINAQTVKNFAENRFTEWGGKAKLEECLGELQ